MTSMPFWPPAQRPTVMGTRHAVAAGHYLAAHAGFTILEAGGNAIDAGVAAGLVINVVEIELTGIQGIVPIIIYLANGDEVVTVAGVGTWPKAATCEFFQRHHGGKLAAGSILEAIVPAAPDAWITALEKWGTMSFGEVAEAAIRFARDGFAMYPTMRRLISERAENALRWPESAAIFMPGGRVPEVGELFVQSDLAGSLQYMADEEAAAAKRGREAGLRAARDAFYRGDIGRAMVRFHEENEGLITAEDMESFKVRVEPPVASRFRDIDVFACGPWCQGPALLQALNLLESFDLGGFGHNSPAYVHVVAEAINLALADRESYYGDPQFVQVPLDELLSKSYAETRRALIRPDIAWPEMPPPGELPGAEGRSASGQSSASRAPGTNPVGSSSGLNTSYVAVVDRHGNAFSATPTDGLMGCPVVPGTGIGTSMSGRPFWADADHPASVAPGKRPRTQCSPAIAMRKGKQLMPFGTPGADVIMQAMLQVFLNVFVFGMDAQAAVEAPRVASYNFPETFFPHEYQPGLLKLERPIADDVGAALSAMGHRIEWWPNRFWQVGNVSLVLSDRETGVLYAASDHRRGGYAVGW